MSFKFANFRALTIGEHGKAIGSQRLRIFYTLGPDKTIVILSGYDKLGNSHKRNQQKEIEQARKYRKQWLKVEM